MKRLIAFWAVCVGVTVPWMASGARTPATPKIDSPHIRFVYWDVGNVLVNDVNAAKRADLVERYRLDTARVDTCFAQFRYDADLGQVSDCGFWLMVTRCAGLPRETAALDGAHICRLTPFITPIRESIGLLIGMAASDIPVGILSDDSREMALAKAEAGGYLAQTSVLIVSGFVGLKKPGRPIFDLALHEARRILQDDTASPGALLFIDDNPDNIAGAAAAGISTIRYHDPAQVRNDLRERFGIILE